MKKLFAFLFLVPAFSSCTDSIIEYGTEGFEKNHKMDGIEAHTVTYDDILTLTQGQNFITRSSSTKFTSKVECLTNSSNDTILYVNKKPNGGWIIYSSDTRVPLVVAQSESGSFDDIMQIESAQLWVRSLIEDMALIKRLPDEELNFSRKEIAENKAFWKSISSPDKFVRENLALDTRAYRGPFDPSLGHYEFRYSTSYTEVYDSIPRLTTTNWTQNHPYNYYCPQKSTNSTKAPAGCVAIAGAQMLYFLHGHYGVPTTAPSEAVETSVASFTVMSAVE